MDDSNNVADIHKTLDAKPPEMGKSDLGLVSLDSPVKSTAVVKYSAVQCPTTFAELQCNTDLNLPPSNWLSSSAESYGLQQPSAHSSGFSSFRLAHMFPDCVGQVDVVSDAENIKKLLKIPYSRGAVSMMVHRVENTLLIDEFDIHKLLLHQSKTDWEWLREFFISNVLQQMSIKDKGLLHSHRRAALQNRLLVSKFLHHSLVAANPPPPPPLSEPTAKLPVSTEPLLPEPKGCEELPDPGSKHNFLRNVVWTFENTQMLIGTDMPIFGGSTHPCISLRLCDMAKPISVLTGIDYWLDNLMSNVPEVVMCFHLDGIVQRYELVKTEDLPQLNGSRFSPKVIRDVAQHILSFLKTNVAKAGHTYWLFKGKDEDVVKLYDLTSLCCGSIDEKGQNPFTVPVAMLLYRVARNMKQSADARHQQGTIRMLLDNCVRLLDAQKYPQIATSAHYMLADLYIPSTMDPSDPVFNDERSEVGSKKDSKAGKRGRTSSLSKNCRPPSASSQRPRRNSYDGYLNILSSDTEADVSDAIESGGKRTEVSLNEVRSLDLSNMQVQPTESTEDSEESGLTKPLPLTTSVQERCQQALKHVVVGLQCLRYFEQPEKEKEHKKETNLKPEFEEEPQMAKPFEPIPMPYFPLKTDRSHKTSKVDNSSAMNSVDPSRPELPIGKKGKVVKNIKLMESKKRSEQQQQSASTNSEGNGIKKFLCPSVPGCMPTWQTPDVHDNSFWNAHLKILLYEKTCLVYATLAEQSYSTEKYALSLRMISLVLRCCEVLDRLMPGMRPNAGLTSYLLGRAGDCCFMLVQRWASVDQQRHDLVANSGVDAEIEHEMFRDCSEMDGVDLSLIPEKIESLEQMLLASLKCYDRAKSLDPKQDNLYRRIGNVHNELGVLYMGKAAEHYQRIVQLQAGKNKDTDEETSSFKLLFSKSLEHLESGVQAFEVVADAANLALLHSNTGRLLRLCAHFHEPVSNNDKDLLSQERRFYNKALASYQKALQVLGNRKSNPAVWDTVTWELSTALYNLAVLSQDFPGSNSKHPEDAERTAVDLLHRALKYCDVETQGPRQPVYQFRVASIHHRLGSLYHKSYRSLQGSEESRHAKGVLQSCRLHYEKACEIFSLLENAVGYFNVVLERVALFELQAQNASNVPGKLRALNLALELLLAANPMLACVAARQSSLKSGANTSGASVDKTADEDDEEEKKLLNLFEQRLQTILLTATKLSSNSGKKDLESAKLLYKNMYSVCLHALGTSKTKGKDNVVALAKHLFSIVSQLEPFMKEMTRVGK